MLVDVTLSWLAPPVVARAASTLLPSPHSPQAGLFAAVAGLATLNEAWVLDLVEAGTSPDGREVGETIAGGMHLGTAVTGEEAIRQSAPAADATHDRTQSQPPPQQPGEGNGKAGGMGGGQGAHATGTGTGTGEFPPQVVADPGQSLIPSAAGAMRAVGGSPAGIGTPARAAEGEARETWNHQALDGARTGRGAGEGTGTGKANRKTHLREGMAPTLPRRPLPGPTLTPTGWQVFTRGRVVLQWRLPLYKDKHNSSS